MHGDRRLRYPMKLVGGQWQRISWDTAVNEIGDKLIAQRVREMDDVRREHTQKMLDKVRAGERDVLC